MPDYKNTSICSVKKATSKPEECWGRCSGKRNCMENETNIPKNRQKYIYLTKKNIYANPSRGWTGRQ